METIFMNSKNSKTSRPHSLLLNLSDKINLKKEVINILLYQILALTIHGIKSRIKIINIKYQLRYRMMSLNYLIDHILYQMFNVILIILLKSIKIYSKSSSKKKCK